MYTASISIGRNVGDKPMPSREWQAFQGECHSLLDITYTKAIGEGEWEGEDGITIREDSAIFLGIIEDADKAKAALASIAAKYGQEGIGLLLVEGTDTVVERAAL